MSDLDHLMAFDDLCDVLLPLGALNSPAELHGLLCGKLSGGARLDGQRWLAVAWEFLDLAGEAAGAAAIALEQLHAVTLAQLQDDGFGLELQLPDDDTELEQRLTALSQWCHGFLSGFGSAGIDGRQQLSADASDALRDFAAIVQIGTDEEDDDEAEAQYMQLVEYVRMATLTLFMEFAAAEPAPVSDRQLH
ncbi:UPF0149 family protein [Exilibacterium tricleocarpae]|uniref:UPF0149 family protein n=1 Tax=Exilibacterium tricleocarpae TaxID=2591008 RepID=A0A545SXK7_9GAMM|nr:UPF0149 family protein [Exilibacterium tricleocarpae]TQV69698.1 UPF0149 family protein [Exilibacterium tricleocarpae]